MRPPLTTFVFLTFVLIAFFVLIPSHASIAASLYLKSDGVQEDGMLKIDLFASTGIKEPFNAASARISLLTDGPLAAHIDTSDSIFDLWSESPVIDENGLLSFSGGTTGKGGFIFDGKLLSLLFRPTPRASTTLAFQDAEVLAADGEGTNILTRTEGYRFRVEEGIPSSFDTNNDGDVSLTELSIGLADG